MPNNFEVTFSFSLWVSLVWSLLSLCCLVMLLLCEAFWTFVGMSACGILLLFFANFVLFALLSFYHLTQNEFSHGPEYKQADALFCINGNTQIL